MRIVENLTRINDKIGSLPSISQEEIESQAKETLSRLSQLYKGEAQAILTETVDEEGFGLVHYIIILGLKSLLK